MCTWSSQIERSFFRVATTTKAEPAQALCAMPMFRDCYKCTKATQPPTAQQESHHVLHHPAFSGRAEHGQLWWQGAWRHGDEVDRRGRLCLRHQLGQGLLRDGVRGRHSFPPPHHDWRLGGGGGHTGLHRHHQHEHLGRGAQRRHEKWRHGPHHGVPDRVRGGRFTWPQDAGGPVDAVNTRRDGCGTARQRASAPTAQGRASRSALPGPRLKPARLEAFPACAALRHGLLLRSRDRCWRKEWRGKSSRRWGRW